MTNADSPTESTKTTWPLPESQGGWRCLSGEEEVRELGGMDPAILAILEREQELLCAGDSYGVVIVRHGHLVHECYSFNVATTTRFDIWSGTKSLTSTAWGVALEDSRQGLLPGGAKVDLDTPIYDLIPEGHPLTDPRKQQITIGQVLSMTSGIAGQDAGAYGSATPTGVGSFEYILGRSLGRPGNSVAKLVADPGTRWDYSDPGFSHLTLALSHLLGREMGDYLRERVLQPIGMEGASWGDQGGSGPGLIGPHTNAHTGFIASARDLARFGELMLRRGRMGERQLIAEWWVNTATRSSQELNPGYGYGWVVNTPGTTWPYLPADAYTADGYRSNRCYVVPSLDLVVTRVATGPGLWDESLLMQRVAEALLDA